MSQELASLRKGWLSKPEDDVSSESPARSKRSSRRLRAVRKTYKVESDEEGEEKGKVGGKHELDEAGGGGEEGHADV